MDIIEIPPNSELIVTISSLINTEIETMKDVQVRLPLYCTFHSRQRRNTKMFIHYSMNIISILSNREKIDLQQRPGCSCESFGARLATRLYGYESLTPEVIDAESQTAVSLDWIYAVPR